jgi:excisionase family DNA binding protein
MGNNKLLTVLEYAALMKVSRGTVYRWITTNKVPYIKVGGTIRIKENSEQQVEVK